MKRNAMVTCGVLAMAVSLLHAGGGDEPDLAALGLEDSHTLAAETMALAERLGLEGEALAALKLWVDAVQGGQAEHEALTAARRTLDVHARRQAE